MPPRQPLEPEATLMDQSLWAEALNVQSNAQFHGADGAGDDDAMHHRSVSEVGIQGQPLTRRDSNA